MTTIDRFTYSSAPVKRVKAVQFGTWDPEEIKKYSVCKVEAAELYEKGRPKPGGLSDPRMGTMDKFGGVCTTDGCNMYDCPGYFGHLELAAPMFHCGFIKTVVRVLRCVSYHTSQLLLPKDDPRYRLGLLRAKPEARLRYFTALCASKRVDEATGAPQPSYRLEGVKIVLEFPKPKNADDPIASQIPESERRQELSAARCYDILRRIPDADARALGFDPRFTRPDWLLITVLPVPPPPVRPSVLMDSSARCEDDLTHKLIEIVRANAALRRQTLNGAPQHILGEFSALLQFHLTTYFDNGIPGQPPALQRSGRPIKAISARLKGKGGRVRGNLMGKRVDFSARTVITGDPNIGIDELGVPWSIALNLTFPETVTPGNRARLQALADAGPHPPPGQTGAKCIVRADGRRVNLAYARADADRRLEVGDRVERHLRTGDLVLFNRQPSLHKMSMMGHRVRVLPFSTFRLNLSVTSPYNADFDGDEMNMHVAQSHETRAEMREIMMVPRNIVSPQANKPVIGVVQDSLLSCRLMTKRDTFIPKDVFMNILMNIEDWDGTVPTPAILKPQPLWTGKQVLSLFIPRVNLRRTSAWYNESDERDFSRDDSQVLIVDGQLITGGLCKKSLGQQGGGLVHVVWLERGPDECRRFLNNCQFASNHWLLQHGMSIGIGDTVADDATMATINAIIETAKEEVKNVIVEFQGGRLEPQPGRTMMETFEGKVNTALNKARDDSGKRAQASLSWNNNVVRMVTAGSKGSFINISQMMACVGQQNVEGKRIPFGFRDRTLPHFVKDDYGPESRGFVENSYLRGLTPQEFFFHAMGGREGLIDTAVKTSSTGYIQRRLVKAMEDLSIKYDGTVRNSAGDVVEFLYGEDGMDGTLVEGQSIEHLRLDARALARRFCYDDVLNARGGGGGGGGAGGGASAAAASSSCPDWLTPETAEALRTDPKARAAVDAEWRAVLGDVDVMRNEVLRSGEAAVNVPVNFRRLVWGAQTRWACGPARPPPATAMPSPLEVISRVRDLSSKLVVVAGTDALSREAQHNATITFMTLLRGALASKRVLGEYRLSSEAFDWLVGEIESRFVQALANPGEAIGTVAAQSIGEPTTQMTLNTFHFAGVSAKNVTLGVPRLTEIINLAKQIKTPSLSVYLTPSHARDKDLAKDIQCTLEYTALRNVTARSEVWYDPLDADEPAATAVVGDRDLLQGYYELEEAPEVGRVSPWLLRLEMDRAMMVDKKLTMQGISTKIQEEYQDLLDVIVSDDNAPQQVVRLRILSSGGGGAGGGKDGMDGGQQQGDDAVDAAAEANDETMRRLDAQYLRDLKLQGVERIRKVFLRTQKCVTPDAAAPTGFATVEEWLLDTEGVNLQQVLSYPGVDATRTTSNDLIEIIADLGVEAVRNALLKELRSVIEFDGSYVNYRHLAILCDVMTCRGHLMAITRHGINRTDASPLAQCSFEETVDILYRAATFGERDRMTGVSENIILGQVVPVGTGAFDLLLDETALRDAYAYEMGAEGGGEEEWFAGHREDLFPSEGAGGAAGGGGVDGVSAMAPPPPMDVMRTPMVGGFMMTPAHPSMMGGGGGFGAGAGRFSALRDIQFSPSREGGGGGGFGGVTSPYSPGGGGNLYSPSSPQFSPQSPTFSPQSPAFFSPASPNFSPQSPALYGSGMSPTSPAFSPTSPYAAGPTSPAYSPTSPALSPTSPAYSPQSPIQGQGAGAAVGGYTSPAYSPTSVRYSPNAAGAAAFNPQSPRYSPTSVAYSPVSPTYSPSSPSYEPAQGGAAGGGGVFQFSPQSPSYAPAEQQQPQQQQPPQQQQQPPPQQDGQQ